MEKSTQMGTNRTGVDMSPQQSKAMLNDTKQYSPEAHDGNGAIASLERSYIESGSPVGSVPMPGTMKGAMTSVMDKLSGHNPEVFINKLGERLAYERTGVRLYDSFIRKCESLGESAISPVPLSELKRIRDEEAQHFQILKESMEGIGADPTAQTPDADVSGVASLGFGKVLTDPRTTVSQCLEALLMVELADNAAWELLIEMSDNMGMTEVSNRFKHALKQEKDHEQNIREWYRQSLNAQVEKGRQTQH